MTAKLKREMKFGVDGYVYVYRNLNGRKDRRDGIKRYTKFSWNKFEHNKDRYIIANYPESLLFRFRYSLESWSDSWVSMSMTHRLAIAGIIVIAIINIMMALLGFYLKHIGYI